MGLANQAGHESLGESQHPANPAQTKQTSTSACLCGTTLLLFFGYSLGATAEALNENHALCTFNPEVWVVGLVRLLRERSLRSSAGILQTTCFDETWGGAANEKGARRMRK